MGQVLHGSATTTEAVGRTIQGRQESLRTFSTSCGIDPNRRQVETADLPTGPREPRPTTLSAAEEAIVVDLRWHNAAAA